MTKPNRLILLLLGIVSLLTLVSNFDLVLAGPRIDDPEITFSQNQPVSIGLPDEESRFTPLAPDDLTHFTPVDPTDRPYIITVRDAQYLGEDLIAGDEIAVFDGNMCVGATRYIGVYSVQITAWQSWEQHQLPGFTPGNPIIFRIWSSREDNELEARATYIHGNGVFSFGSYSEVILRTGDVYLMLTPLRNCYFELVSFYVATTDMNATTIFSTIQGLAIAYQDDGRIFVPIIDGPDVNTIGNISISEGYQVFCMQVTELLLEGDLVDPLTPIALRGNRWNWLGYPVSYPIPVEQALQSILDWVVIIMNSDGRVWVPGIVNTLGELQPGRGYYAFTNQEVVFQYNFAQARKQTDYSEVINVPELPDAPPATGLPYALLIQLDNELSNAHPAVIEVYDGRLLVGKSVVLDDYDITPVIAWRGSPEYGVIGFTQGNSFQVRLKRQDGSLIETVTQGKETVFGEGAYASLKLCKADLPVDFRLMPGYPNPFNPSVTLPFTLPTSGEVVFRLYNILGRKVYEFSDYYPAGDNSFHLDARLIGDELVSGVYVVEANFGSVNQYSKVLLLK